MPRLWLPLLALVLSVVADKTNRVVAPRIVGGTEISAHSYPFLVRLCAAAGPTTKPEPSLN